MSIILLIVVILFVKSLSLPETAGFQREYLSKKSTAAVKGVFVVLIFLSHYSQYITEGAYDAAYRIFQNHLNQMVVAMFLFYSGYGVMESIKKKGFSYVTSIPVKRVLTVLVDFDIAVLIYALLGVCVFGKRYDFSTILLSLIGWKSAGNSNWYIFAVLVLYLMTFLAFCLVKPGGDRKAWRTGCSLVLLTVLIMGFVYVEMKLGQPKYCYNTVILYALGAWYSFLKKPIEKVVMRSDISYYAVVLLMLMVYFLSYFRRWDYGIEGYTVWATAFTLLVVLFTMKVKIVSRCFEWFGNHIFGIYILQRIPMNLLQHFQYIDRHKYSCFVLCLVCTILLAELFQRFTVALNGKIIHLFNREG